jgi:L-ascorbate metabolism protein UlaG (beta-lactamase superfamily)
MTMRCLPALYLITALGGLAMAQNALPRDTFETTAGRLEITVLGHASLMLRSGGKVIHIDPFSRVADYGDLPHADLVLITHDHHDHLDPQALREVSSDATVTVVARACRGKVDDAVIMDNGEQRTVAGVPIQAVPAYNIEHKRASGQPFHPRGAGNGYVLTFGNLRVYVAGDTELIPEMDQLGDIDIAFLPANLPYTMDAQMAATAARTIAPKVLFPYHFRFGDSTVPQLLELLEDAPAIEVRVRAGE